MSWLLAGLGCIAALALCLPVSTGMERCEARHTAATCFHALNR